MNNNLEKVIKFLDESQTYYLATVDKYNQPRVRPFGTALIYKDRLYIQTGKVKDVSNQIKKNPNVELCAFKDGKWIRVRGKLVLDDRFEAKKDMLDKNPGLRRMYSENDGNTEVYYFDGGEAIFSEFGKESRIVKF